MKHTHEGELLTGIILDTFKLNGLLTLEGDSLIKELGLNSARWKILGALSHGSGLMTVPDIARMMGQSRQGVQRLSNEMRNEGLLVTKTNPDHKRAKLLTLTDSGEKAYALAMQKQIPWANSIANEFKESDLKLVLSVLQKLNSQFNA